MAPPHPFTITAKDGSSVALVAGGAGFLGASLCRFLLAKKIKVIGVLDFKSSRRENIEEFTTEKNFLLLEHDLSHPLPQIEQLDYIFHLAGLEEDLNGEEISLEILKVDSLGTQNLLELARQTRAKFLFASTFEIFSDLPLQTKVVSSLEEQQKSFSPHEAKRFSESLIAEYSRLYNLNCRIVRLADIYGPGMNLGAATEIARLIKAAKEGRPLTIFGEGLEVLYPTFTEDAIEGIARAAFLSHTAGKIYNLAGPKTTVLKLAQLLKELAKEKSQIDFGKAKNVKEKLLLPPDFKKTQEELGWEPKVSLEEGLRRVLGVAEKKEPSKNEAPKEDKPLKTPPAKELIEQEKRFFLFGFQVKLIFATLLLTFAFTFPFWDLSWDIFWGQKNLTALEEPSSLTLPKLKTKAWQAESHFLSGQAKLKDLTWFFKVTRQEGRQRVWREKFATGVDIAAGAGRAAQAGEIFEKVGEKIFAGGEVEDKEFKEAAVFLAAAYELWGEAEAKLRQSSTAQDQKRAAQLAELRQLLKEGQNWLEVFPQIIALNDQKTYLLLLQNNMETRPTGGFIGTFGLLTFKKGQLEDLKIEDIYTADGQLKGHVEPPEPIKKYLGKEHWFLRDANWDPDFPQTAEIAQWFLEKEMGVKTDGVLAFDLNLAKIFLEVLGPLKLLDYQETVGSGDLFAKTQKYTEADFFPGSTQKRDFLSSLTKALVEKIKQEKERWPPLGKATSLALKERHLLIYFSSPALEQKVLQNGWGGEVRETPCQVAPGCLGDYLMVIEANLGVNKVNWWVKKEIKDEIVLAEDGGLSHKLTLSYQNSSSLLSWAGGTYKNYLRIYTPAGAVLDNLKIGETATAAADLAQTPRKTTFGVYFEVPPQSKKEIVVIYHLSPKPGQVKSYQFLFQKQAGSQAESLSLEIFYPPSWRPQPNSSLATSSGVKGLTQPSRLQYNGEPSVDKEFKVDFLP